ncbi:MAG TPA: TetR/AcrR family transcriptional regulator [Solirubrobacterales bacterium]|nr:TetR/AcrR family transcriptional regulator [Solirubrobacterales bacterium]
MGEQAEPKVLAGAEEAGEMGATPPHASTLKLVISPKRERILEGMLHSVGSDGYDATSVRTVLDSTGLYRQAFYDLFPDKEACYLEAFDLGMERLDAQVQAAAAPEKTWQGKLRAGLGALLQALDNEPDLGRALIVEVHAAGPEALEKRSKVMKRITDFIDSARAAPGEGESPPPIAPEGIVAGIHSVVHARLATGATEGFRELLPEFMYFAVLPYFGSELAEQEMQAARA